MHAHWSLRAIVLCRETPIGRSPPFSSSRHRCLQHLHCSDDPQPSLMQQIMQFLLHANDLLSQPKSCVVGQTVTDCAHFTATKNTSVFLNWSDWHLTNNLYSVCGDELLLLVLSVQLPCQRRVHEIERISIREG